MGSDSAVLLVSIFLIGWLVSGFLLMGPEIIRQLRAKRRMDRWRRLTSEKADANPDDASNTSPKRNKLGPPP
jgi:hypothetical protein